MYAARASSMLRASSFTGNTAARSLSLSSLKTPSRRHVRQFYTSTKTVVGAAKRTTTLPRSTTTNITTKFGAITIPKRGFLQTAGIAVERGLVKTGEKLRINRNMAFGLGGGLALAGFHSATGSANDFYEYRFKSKKSPDDLASFFGGETFMELFCVFPIVGVLMMRMGYFDDEGTVITQGVPGTMKVSMVFSDETNEETGETDWFNKRERFRNVCFGYDCWDMVTNFGFRTLDDGSREVYMNGEYFHGNLPLVSQLMRVVFTVHARWLAWSTEHHINHFAFTAGNEREEHLEEESRNNMPVFLLKHYAFSDLLAMLFGYDLNKSTSFLILKMSMVGLSEEEEEDDDDEEEEEEEEEVEAVAELSLQNHRTLLKRRVSLDIEFDRDNTKQLLARHRTTSLTELTPMDKQVILARKSTLRKDDSSSIGSSSTEMNVGAYDLAREAAHQKLVVRRATLQAMKLSSKEDELLASGEETNSTTTPSVVLLEEQSVNVPLAAAA